MELGVIWFFVGMDQPNIGLPWQLFSNVSWIRQAQHMTAFSPAHDKSNRSGSRSLTHQASINTMRHTLSTVEICSLSDIDTMVLWHLLPQLQEQGTESRTMFFTLEIVNGHTTKLSEQSNPPLSLWNWLYIPLINAGNKISWDQLHFKLVINPKNPETYFDSGVMFMGLRWCLQNVDSPYSVQNKRRIIVTYFWVTIRG